MKKLILTALLILGISGLSAKTVTVYCKIKEIPSANISLAQNYVRILVDDGSPERMFKRNTIDNPNGKPMDFYSLVDAMNYLSSEGWQFCQAYEVTDHEDGKADTHTTYVIMKKEIDDSLLKNWQNDDDSVKLNSKALRNSK